MTKCADGPSRLAIAEGQRRARCVDAASSSCGGGGVGCGSWCWAGSVPYECACKSCMQPAREACHQACALPLAPPVAPHCHLLLRAPHAYTCGGVGMADVLGRSDRGSWARAQWRRSPPYCSAIVRAAARVASCPHRRLILHAHAPVRGVACAYTYMCICIYAYVYACEPLTCHMLGVACECVRLDLGWPYRHSRARNAQGSLCICHVGLSRNWGSITNGLSRQ